MSMCWFFCKRSWRNLTRRQHSHDLLDIFTWLTYLSDLFDFLDWLTSDLFDWLTCLTDWLIDFHILVTEWWSCPNARDAITSKKKRIYLSRVIINHQKAEWWGNGSSNTIVKYIFRCLWHTLNINTHLPHKLIILSLPFIFWTEWRPPAETNGWRSESLYTLPYKTVSVD